MTSRTSRTRRLVAAAASTAVLALGVAACSGQGADDNAGGATSSDLSLAGPKAGSAARDAEVPEAAAGDSLEDAAGSAADGTSVEVASAGGSSTAGRSPDRALEPTDDRALVKEGNVALSSTAVGDTLFEIAKVVQRAGGEVSSNDTQADSQGEPKTALLTVRVPVGRFSSALDELRDLGTAGGGVRLISATSSTKDVTTQVVDTDVRVELQKRSIERISLLLDRASSIRDIVGIERELAAREADLGSLEKRQASLENQTARSTITVSVERPAAKKKAAEKKAEEKDESGFAGGLHHGWDAFKDVTTGLLTVVGALLPFGIVALLVGVPLRAWLRRRQPRAAVGASDATAPAGA